jgi:hypothetical protein
MPTTMRRMLMRAASLALLGAVAGGASLLAFVNMHPAIVLDMDRDLPGRVLTGVSTPEIIGGESFTWTSQRAFLNVQGADRRLPWTCEARFRGARSAGQPQPEVSVVLDGRVLGARTATNDYETLDVIVPPQPQRGLRLALESSNTFTPGPSDPRQLGVRLDRLACAPAPGHFLWPPADAIANAALTGAVFALLIAAAGAPTWLAITGVLGVALLQAVPMSISVAPYTPYVDRVLRAAVWIAGIAGASLLAAARWRPLSPGARVAIVYSAAALFLKLAVLLHPMKPVVDGLYHAHRYDYVASGHYFFTQILPGGVHFPYSIALYVFALPWGSFMRDHVALLRIVVSASEAVAGLLLYWAVVRQWRDGLAGAMAVVLFHLMPVSYWVIGNANLTNAFGQQAALATMALAIGWQFQARMWLQVLALGAVAATAFLSHVSTFTLLGPTMIASALAVWWRGGRALAAPARAMVLAALVGVLAAVALYYGRPEFYPAYRSIGAAKPEPGAITAVDEPVEERGAVRLEEGAVPVMTPTARVRDAVHLVRDGLTWSIVLLGVLGAWRIWVRPAGDRLSWVIGGWLAIAVVFSALGIVLPGYIGHQRQMWEFIARTIYTSAPAALMLAGAGGAWAWRRGASWRAAVLCLIAMTFVQTARLCVDWIT